MVWAECYNLPMNSWMKKFNKVNILLILIIFISLVFRFLCLDEPGGLWYDELVSYREAHQSSILNIIVCTLTTDVHLPLYPLFLHFWSKLFSFSDFSLRAFSAVCGVITIFVSYFVGKELKSKQTGLMCACVFTVNSFLIFYSQSVRMYSLLMLSSLVFLLFLLRIKNNYKNKWNYFGLVLFALMILNTYTLAFVFVIAQFLVFIFYLILKKDENTKEIFKNIMISIGALFFFSVPLILYLSNNSTRYLSEINGFYCDWSSLFVFVQNWFSPVLVGLFNNPPHYMRTFFTHLSMLEFIFILMPIAISIYSIFYAVKKDKFSLVILSSSLIFLLSEIIAFQFTNFKILSRYTAICFPNILILVGYGLSLIESRKKKILLVGTFFVINLFYLIAMPDAAFRRTRGGFRPLAETLNSVSVADKDVVLVWNRQKVLDKYVDKDLNIVSVLKNFAYRSEHMVVNEQYLKTLPLNERKAKMRWYFESRNIPKNTQYTMDIIYNYLKPEQKFIITTTSNFDSFTRNAFIELVKDDKRFEEISFNDLLTIKAIVNIKELSYQKFRFVKKLQNKGFVVIVFKK